MAQRRMLSKSISTSKKLNKVGDQAALLFTWTLGHFDDFGNMDGSAEQLRAIVVPLRKWSIVRVEALKGELCAIGAWINYAIGDDSYIHCEKFDDFQTFKADRERVSLYPKYKEDLRKPLDSTRKPLDSYKLSEVKGNEVNLISSQTKTFQKNYLSKFSNPKKVYSSKHLLSAEISEWSHGQLKIPMLMKFCGVKGEQFVRQCWAEAKDSNAKDQTALFMSFYGKQKVVMRESAEVKTN